MIFWFLCRNLGSTLGYLAGNHIVAVYHTINHYQWYVIGGLAAAASVYLGLRHFRHRRGKLVD